jgi:hypothetical protein
MASNTQHRPMLRAVLSLVIASAMALGIMAGTVGVRHAAASQGCDAVNAISTQLAPSVSLASGLFFDNGDVVSLTAGDPSSGSPSFVQITVDNGIVAGANFPGTATWTLTGSGAIGTLTFLVDTGSATLDPMCVAAPPTVTPTEISTEIPTETPTVIPTVIETAIITETPEPGATEPPATEPATPIAAAPTSTPPAGPVSELPGTGGGPSGGADRGPIWFLLALLAAAGLGIGGLRARQRR